MQINSRVKIGDKQLAISNRIPVNKIYLIIRLKYEKRKKQRFPSADELLISKNPAFLFENKEEYERFEKE